MQVSCVGIVIPTYKRPELVKEAVTSALAQDYENFRVWVVNDCPDMSLDQDSRVRYIQHSVRGGNAVARNTGVRAALTAECNYVVCLDDDDLITPRVVSEMVKVLDAGDAQIATLPGCPELSSDILFQNYIPCFSMFRVDLWLTVGGYQYPSQICEGFVDWDFFIRCWKKGARSQSCILEGETGFIHRSRYSRIEPIYGDMTVYAKMYEDLKRRHGIA